MDTMSPLILYKRNKKIKEKLQQETGSMDILVLVIPILKLVHSFFIDSNLGQLPLIYL